MGMMMGMQAAMQGNEESDTTPAIKSEDKHVSWSPRSFRMVVVVVSPNTPWKFNIAPEKWWLEDYFHIGFR